MGHIHIIGIESTQVFLIFWFGDHTQFWVQGTIWDQESNLVRFHIRQTDTLPTVLPLRPHPPRFLFLFFLGGGCLFFGPRLVQPICGAEAGIRLKLKSQIGQMLYPCKAHPPNFYCWGAYLAVLRAPSCLCAQRSWRQRVRSSGQISSCS